MSISLESVGKINALKQGIEAVTGETYNDLTTGIQALKNNYTTDEQIQAVNSWDLIKEYFENHAHNAHQLFVKPPKDADGNDMFYKLPYIYTPRTVWHSNQTAFSPYVLEAGIDVSSAINIGLRGSSARTLSPLPNLERLVITGNANAQSLNETFQSNEKMKYVKFETPNEDVLKANSSYYISTFNWCKSLETIDCELDFTGQTAVGKIFVLCYKLKHLTIKPFTLSTSLDFSYCYVLHQTDSDDYESLISILNSITNDSTVASTMTMTFSNDIKDNQNANDYWDKTVYLDSADGIYYSEQAEGRTEYSLYNAFLNKGVTIAWV